jgi:hypothetical protein
MISPSRHSRLRFWNSPTTSSWISRTATPTTSRCWLPAAQLPGHPHCRAGGNPRAIPSVQGTGHGWLSGLLLCQA